MKIIELKNIIEKELNYNFISELSVDEYRKFIYNFFLIFI